MWPPVSMFVLINWCVSFHLDIKLFNLFFHFALIFFLQHCSSTLINNWSVYVNILSVPWWSSKLTGFTLVALEPNRCLLFIWFLLTLTYNVNNYLLVCEIWYFAVFLKLEGLGVIMMVGQNGGQIVWRIMLKGEQMRIMRCLSQFLNLIELHCLCPPEYLV